MVKVRPWTALDFFLMFLMWAVMMIGMMVPTAMPMTLVYAGVARKANAQDTPLAPTATFVAGYVVMVDVPPGVMAPDSAEISNSPAAL